MEKKQQYYGYTKNIEGGFDIITSLIPLGEDVVVATVTGPRAEEMALNASGFKNSYSKEYYVS